MRPEPERPLRRVWLVRVPAGTAGMVSPYARTKSFRARFWFSIRYVSNFSARKYPRYPQS
jgi:hypothetical protein